MLAQFHGEGMSSNDVELTLNTNVTPADDHSTSKHDFMNIQAVLFLNQSSEQGVQYPWMLYSRF